MFTPRDRILIGVSGGADSTALMFILRELGYEFAIAHLNHRLRGAESEQDEAFVKGLGQELGIEVFTESADLSRNAGNLEASGRNARRSFFKALMQTQGFTKMALAHHREDRVETFLLHLLRGAGTEGLVSMSPVAGQIVRPLIEVSRADLEGYLTGLGRNWRTDATNSDISFSRNRLRHEIIPRLASLFNSRLVESLSRTIHVLEDEDSWMKELTATWLEITRDEAGLDVGALNTLPVALVRRILRQALSADGGHLTDITFEHIEAMRGLLEEGKSGKSLDLPGGTIVRREFHRLVFTRSGAEIAEFSYDLPIPGCVRIPELGRSFRAECVDMAREEAPNQAAERVFVDGDGLGACVKIRNWKPGDYYRPAGWPAGKVKKLFQKARIPRSQRNRWPILASESGVIWVTSFPVSREFVPGPGTKKIVAFEALEG
jgi:tRNA(Ile)-lysidine synthase